MRAFRYFLAGFETLVALFFFCLFAGGLAATVQLSVQRTPLEGARRAVVVAELGQAMVVSVMGGVSASNHLRGGHAEIRHALWEKPLRVSVGYQFESLSYTRLDLFHGYFSAKRFISHTALLTSRVRRAVSTTTTISMSEKRLTRGLC